MLEINMDDVMNVLNTCKPYLIGFAVVMVAALVVMAAVGKMEKPRRKFVRAQSMILILAALAVTVNMICFGPVSTLITLATGGGTITESTTEEATQLCEQIAEEGIVLLKNDGLLPLAGIDKLNVFGWASTNPCYGGTGSGALSDAYPTVSLLEGIEHTGIQVNQDLVKFYSEYADQRPEVAITHQDWTLPEPAADSYPDSLLSSAKEFSDVALVVITRVGGEGADIPRDVSQAAYTNNSDAYEDFAAGEHYLQLSQTEKDMLGMVCSNFNDVVVVYNGANAMELGFLNEYSQIKGALWCPGTGQSGFLALGNILAGKVNPSGRTSDTFVADLTATPNYNNFGNFAYDNVDEFTVESYGNPVTPTFVNYSEGIYVGYRFYETAAEEGLIDYEKTVLYPFGYGLSYTTFKQEMGEVTYKDGTVSFDVTVTNTGDTAGKDVVEVYYNPPYTNGGIEKACASLIVFEKTDSLEPGKSQTIPVTFKEEVMASYDVSGAGAYVLEKGDYKISLRRDSHTVMEEQTCTVEETITYGADHKRSTDQTAAINQFKDAAGDVVYLSRKDGFSNYEEATAAPKSLSMSDEAKAAFINNSNYNYAEDNNDEDQMPVTGAKNGLKLVDFRGIDYDDSSWDKLLDQLTIDDMDNLIANGGFSTAAVSSVGKLGTVDCDGPASINNNFTGVGSIGFPSAVLIANTWNKNMAEAFGQSIGKMADEMDVSGWYAPAMNTHRSAFAGRNFEYYSEDPVLSGKMAANAVSGAWQYGVYGYIKHFATNDQETNRNAQLCTWTNEQALREIYLKPFEIAVKEGGATAVMSAFNYIGTTYAACTHALQQTVLRDEWGFRGMVLTDWYADYGYQNADQLIRNGNDFCLATYDAGSNHVQDKESATSIQAMRQASKNILYTVVNSRTYAEENMKADFFTWKTAAVIIDVILAAGVLALEIMIFKRLKKETAK